MKKRKQIGYGLLFLVFTALFTGFFYLSPENLKSDISDGGNTAQIESAGAPQMRTMTAEVQPPEEEGESETSTPWIIGVAILLFSLISTLLSWTVVEKVVSNRDVTLIPFGDDRGSKMMKVLSNDTCMKILGALQKKQMTESELAEDLDMSIQRIHYNLKSLLEAEMIESDEFRYSEKGREMNVYKLTSKYFIIGPDEE